MRQIRVLVAIMLTLLFSLYCIAFAADDIVIDVVDGYLNTGSYSIQLADVETPISIGLDGGNVILTVETATGESMRLNMGPGRVALTRRANPYVTIEQSSSSTAGGTGAGGTGVDSHPGAVGNCSQCGNPLASGDHTKLRCGHYVCRVGEKHLRVCSSCNEFMCRSSNDHTKCPICGVGFCAHDDFKCYYRHNPAPTPFQTTDPDGNIVYFYISPDGAFIMGNPTGSKMPIWAPGLEYMESNATPSPAPT